ncbi:hypothetical protein WICPIJ_007136 [Wickerhamomyces pijperi]|uniref:Secreted protein n=1 Tax=Wickerhamomyces pijperi TaxID=599730 RepID=A0A9P8TK94_WICPI|nr:hypothetical protein WICPIJ_007136 [Wickerhamomyces pijperi]
MMTFLEAAALLAGLLVADDAAFLAGCFLTTTSSISSSSSSSSSLSSSSLSISIGSLAEMEEGGVDSVDLEGVLALPLPNRPLPKIVLNSGSSDFLNGNVDCFSFSDLTEVDCDVS